MSFIGEFTGTRDGQLIEVEVHQGAEGDIILFFEDRTEVCHPSVRNFEDALREASLKFKIRAVE